jgi:hypothetical protein
VSDLPIINTTIKVENVKDIPYTRKDGTTAVGKAIGHKNPDGSWLNLTDFDEARFPLYFPNSVLSVGYTEKFATEPNGAPKIDKYTNQQKIYRTIISAEPAGGAQTGQSSPAITQGSNAPTQANYGGDRNESIREQTTLKCAAEMYAAMLGASKGKAWDFEEFEGIYISTKNVLDGKNELDVAMDAAKDAGLTEEPPIGFDDKPDPDGSEREPGDADIPW